MGYFSQRKKHQREDMFLRVMLLILGLLCILMFLPSHVLPEAVLNYLFQIFILNALLVFYAFYIKRPGYGTVFAVFLIINFTYISSTANLFNNKMVREEHHINLLFSHNRPLKIKANGMVTLRAGHLNLGSDLQAQFETIEKNYHVFTVIRVDFENASERDRRVALRHLKAFVQMQDDPVIIIGNFGEPAWSTPMKKFLISTQLKVLNRLVLNGRHSVFNPFAIPRFYVLGFDNVGLTDLKLDSADGGFPRFNVGIGFY